MMTLPFVASTLNARLRNGVLRVHAGDSFCEFTRAMAGFPARIGFADGRSAAWRASAPMLSAKTRDGRRVVPHLDEFAPVIRRADRALHVAFHGVSWLTEEGTPLDAFRLSLDYEFHADGAVFVTTFFCTRDRGARSLRDFALQAGLALDRGETANWAYWALPRQAAGQMTQELNRYFERNLTSSESRRKEGMILPFVSFDFGTNGRRDRHAEFFVESWNSLTPDIGNTQTEILWRGNEVAVRWTFQKRTKTVETRGYQWRNVWGWCLRRFPTVRNHAPLRIFHYMDNRDPYPSRRLIRQIAQEGANVLILHESWRLDMQNGEFPFDPASLRRVSHACHAAGMRLMLYLRGNEDAVRETGGDFLRPWLRRNWDGVYVDYGSPYCYLRTDENSPGGRIGFREHHRRCRDLRDLVGPNGLFISHSGSFFSATGHTFVDAYLGGEQEKGALLKNPTTHAYFSGLSVAPSSLWTAAFPTYRTNRSIPYLAATVQTPFLHVGTQLPSSSLDHPRIPSVITFARPLWRLWELFDGKTQIRVYSTQDSVGALRTDGAETGASMIVDRNGDALLIAANLAACAREVRVACDRAKANLSRARACVALAADERAVRAVRAPVPREFRARLAGRGLAGWLLVRNPKAWSVRLRRFLRPWPSHPSDEAAHRRRLETIRAARFSPALWTECYLRVSVPNWPGTWEHSIWFDLYENTVALHLGDSPRGRRLGYISQRGLAQMPPARKDLLWPGCSSPWIPLHDVLRAARAGRGVRPLALVSRKGDSEFYSFVLGELSPRPARVRETRELIYNNEIDLDWSTLAFKVRLV